uniref:ice-binding family protein n=1 Tax=Rhodoferax sp. TaxID=50421 RepID=UPI0025CCFD8A
TATVTNHAADLAGNTLAVNKVWQFTTANAVVDVPLIDLNSVAPFGTFGGTAGMTNMGTLTIINGDIGTTATATDSITGFHDKLGDIYTETTLNKGFVNGKIFTCTNSVTGPTSTGPNAVACAAATQARLDAETAYLALVATPVGGASPAPGANLAGVTLLPGTYVAPGGSFLIEGGNLTLDAKGNANATWVFQMASTLTVGGPGAAAPQSIILAGGALAKNVFWQVGSTATINAAGGGTMVGTIIAQAGVKISTADNVNIVTINGRALSLGASVTMVNTVINVPAQ